MFYFTIFPCYAQDVRDDIVENALDVIEQTNAILSAPESGKNVITKDAPAPGAGEAGQEGSFDDALKPFDIKEQKGGEGPGEILPVDAVDFNETSLREAFNVISQKSHLQIDVQEGVSGYVTLAVNNIDAVDLVKIITDTQELAFHHKNGVVHVMTKNYFEERYGYSFTKEKQSLVLKLDHADPLDIIVRLNRAKSDLGKVIQGKDPRTIFVIDTFLKVDEMKSIVEQMDIPLKTEVFILNYSQPQEVEEKIKPLLTEDVGQVLYDERSQKIVVTDTKETVHKIAKEIASLDKRRVLVMDAEAIQVVLSEEYSEGIDWEAIVTNYYCLGQDDNACKQGMRDLSVGTINEEDYDVLKEALEAVGEVDVIAGPTIKGVTRSRTYLKISPIDSDVIITMANPSYPSSLAKEKRMKGPGVRLFLTPTVHLDNSVSLEVTTELPSPFVEDGAKQQVRTGNLDIQNDSIVVIGGMFKEEQVKMIKKFPLLGDIPLVGLAFRRQRYKTIRTEHVIFLRIKPILTQEE